MTSARQTATGDLFFSRRNRRWRATLALAGAALVMGTACDEEAAGRAFRDAASASLQSGMKNIMDGVIDGMFAIFELGDSEGDTSSTTGTSTTTSTGAGG